MVTAAINSSVFVCSIYGLWRLLPTLQTESRYVAVTTDVAVATDFAVATCVAEGEAAAKERQAITQSPILCLLTPMGPLMGGPQCRLSILRNGNVPCRYFSNVPVDFEIVQCRLSIEMTMSPVVIFKMFLSILR